MVERDAIPRSFRPGAGFLERGEKMPLIGSHPAIHNQGRPNFRRGAEKCGHGAKSSWNVNGISVKTGPFVYFT